MTKTEKIILHLFSSTRHMSATVANDTELWEKYDNMVLHLEALDRKAKLFDKYQEIVSSYISGTESDGISPSHIIDPSDFEHEILRVYRNYKEDNK